MKSPLTRLELGEALFQAIRFAMIAFVNSLHLHNPK